jgi:flagellar basal-body rod protein FlgF
MSSQQVGGAGLFDAMNYGLYLSAAGVMTNSYRQDVIANNLANSETVGFRRDVPLFHERLTSAMEMRSRAQWGEKLFDDLTGGIWAMPTGMDLTQGDLEPTGNSLDAAIVGDGFFQVLTAGGDMRMTRDGRFMVDAAGRLVTPGGQSVLDINGQPIRLNPGRIHSLDKYGTISADGTVVAQLAIVQVTDPTTLRKEGGGLLAVSDPAQIAPATSAELLTQTVERANVDPVIELTQLMDAQRQLEANANMIRYQDQMLSKLVNEVGKIG